MCRPFGAPEAVPNQSWRAAGSPPTNTTARTHEVTRVRGALLTDVGEPFEGNGDTNEVLGVVLDTYDSGRGFE